MLYAVYFTALKMINTVSNSS